MINALVRETGSRVRSLVDSDLVRETGQRVRSMAGSDLVRETGSRVRSLVDAIPVLPGVLDVAGKLVSPGPSLDELVEEFARKGRIDASAPVTGRAEIEVAAPADVVWAVLSDIDGWSRWSKGIHHVAPPSSLTAGNTFVWWNGVSRISSRLAVVQPGVELSWTGVSPGAKGVHRNTVRGLPGGRTALMSEESLNGPMLQHLFPSAKLQQGLQTWVAEVAAEATRRAAA